MIFRLRCWAHIKKYWFELWAAVAIAAASTTKARKRVSPQDIDQKGYLYCNIGHSERSI